MSVATFVLLGLTILVSSFISGVFGMAGGMILLGVLLNYFDVPSAMILFSIIQFCANGWRAYQWRRLCALADLLQIRASAPPSLSRPCTRSRSCPTR